MLEREFGSKKVKLFTYHPKPLATDPIFLLMSKKYKNSKLVLDLFNKGLETRKSNGTFDQYFDAMYHY